MALEEDGKERFRLMSIETYHTLASEPRAVVV